MMSPEQSNTLNEPQIEATIPVQTVPIIQATPAVQFNQTIDPQLQEECRVLIEQHFKKEMADSINAREVWGKLNNTLVIASHIAQGATTILAFVSAALKSPAISIVAGCTGVCAGVCESYGKNCKTRYKDLTKTIEEMTNKIKVMDILPDESDYMNHPNPGYRRTQLPPGILTSYNNLHSDNKHLLATSAATSSQIVTAPTPSSTPAFSPYDRLVC